MEKNKIVNRTIRIVSDINKEKRVLSLDKKLIENNV